MDREDLSVEQFQHILLERKAERKEKAHQRQRENMKLIEDKLKSTSSLTAVDPIPSNTMAKDVWNSIFGQLEDSKDISNMLEVRHLFFRDSEEKSRTQDILLPQVISLGKIPSESLRTLRSVCKSARDAVDLLFEKELLNALQSCSHNSKKTAGGDHLDSYTVDNSIATARIIYDDLYGNHGMEQITRLLANFTNGVVTTRAKRFFPRSLEIIIPHLKTHKDFEDYYDEFEKEWTSLVRIIGHQVLRFAFFADIGDVCESGSGSSSEPETSTSDKDEESDEEKSCKNCPVKSWLSRILSFFHALLTLMPNLKWLEVDIGSHHEQFGQSFFRARAFELGPFPHLSRLERISFFFLRSEKQGYWILDSLLRANPHIRILDLEPRKDKYYEHLNVDDESKNFFELFRELTQSIPLDLEVLHIGGRAWRTRVVPLEIILPSINLNWKLKKLFLGFDFAHSRRSSLESIFHFVNDFPTLEHLTIEINEVSIGYQDHIPYLNLPNLTEFEMSISREEIDYSNVSEVCFLYSLQFLIHSKKLKSLIWKHHSWPAWGLELGHFLISQETPEKAVDFSGGFKNLKNSNIWNVFPELERVRIETRKLWDDESRWWYEKRMCPLIGKPTPRKRKMFGRQSYKNDRNCVEFRRSNIRGPQYLYHCLFCQCGLYPKCSESKKFLSKNPRYVDPSKVRKEITNRLCHRKGSK